MRSRKFQIFILSLFALILLAGCGGVRDNADTPYNEELIMQMNQEQKKPAEDAETKEAMLQSAMEESGQPEESVVTEQQEEAVQPDEAEVKKENDAEEIRENDFLSETEDVVASETKDGSEKAVAEPKAETKNETDKKENSDIRKEEAVQNLPDTVKQADEKKEDKKEEKNVCTLSVRCDTLLSNMSRLPREKKPLVPENGVIYPQTELEFKEGESVFDVLHRELKKHRIHMEFNESPVYKSAYVEGINNLYEFDCGDLSGWVYKVNGKIGNVGCSQYMLQSGDKVEWLYTCDMGRDV